MAREPRVRMTPDERVAVLEFFEMAWTKLVPADSGPGVVVLSLPEAGLDEFLGTWGNSRAFKRGYDFDFALKVLLNELGEYDRRFTDDIAPECIVASARLDALAEVGHR